MIEFCHSAVVVAKICCGHSRAAQNLHVTRLSCASSSYMCAAGQSHGLITDLERCSIPSHYDTRHRIRSPLLSVTLRQLSVQSSKLKLLTSDGNAKYKTASIIGMVSVVIDD